MENSINAGMVTEGGVPIKVFLSDPKAEIPQYASEHASGLDLKSTIEAVIHPGERTMVPTGLKMEIPHGFEGQVRPRSGLAVKHGITVLNTPGTVDSDYRGEIKVILFNTSKEAFHVEPGMRIAQLVIAPIARVRMERVLSEIGLNSTERGINGFGSTGHR